jgi:hypothetical protein
VARTRQALFSQGFGWANKTGRTKLKFFSHNNRGNTMDKKLRNKFAKIALAAILAFAGAAMAEEEKPAESKKLDTAAIMKTSYNVRGGINFSSSWSSRSVFGFHVGGMVDIPLTLVDIADDAYLIEVHPAAQFIKKGGRLWYRSAYSLFYGWGTKFDAYYLEVPVPFSIKREFSDKISARADFGPYIAFGLFGTENAFEYLSRFDAGVIYGVVIDFAKRYSIGLHSSVGLSEDNLSSLYMTLGYKL